MAEAYFYTTRDLVEVVRCKDCKHYKNYCCYFHSADKNGTPLFMNENDFCSYGIEKDKENL